MDHVARSGYAVEFCVWQLLMQTLGLRVSVNVSVTLAGQDHDGHAELVVMGPEHKRTGEHKRTLGGARPELRWPQRHPNRKLLES